MDTLLLTLKLSTAVRDGDLDAINRLIIELERRLSPEDLLVILEGMLSSCPQPTPPPPASPSPVRCA